MGDDFGCLESSGGDIEPKISNIKEVTKETSAKSNSLVEGGRIKKASAKLEAPRLVSKIISSSKCDESMLKTKTDDNKAVDDSSAADKVAMTQVDADVLTFAPLWLRRADKKVKLIDK